MFDKHYMAKAMRPLQHQQLKEIGEHLIPTVNLDDYLAWCLLTFLTVCGLQMYPNKCLRGYNQGTLQQTLKNKVFIVLALLKQARIKKKYCA